MLCLTFLLLKCTKFLILNISNNSSIQEFLISDEPNYKTCFLLAHSKPKSERTPAYANLCTYIYICKSTSLILDKHICTAVSKYTTFIYCTEYCLETSKELFTYDEKISFSTRYTVLYPNFPIHVRPRTSTAQGSVYCQGLAKGCRRLYLGLDLLCSTSFWPIAFTYIGDNKLQKKETEYSGCGLSLAATAAESSITTAFTNLKCVHNLWSIVCTL